MRRVLLLLAAVGCVTAAALVSLARPDKPAAEVTPLAATPKFIVSTEAKNPWTSLTPNITPDQFQFAIVSDRTGGHRAGIFSKAVQQINLLQPEFVMSVGDLIEGTGSEAGNRILWDEFDGYVKQFAMPFFYCPGNHDALSKVKVGVYKERYGRPYYHFLYKNCLFLVLNSNDPNEPNANGVVAYRGSKIGKEQQQYIAATLKENANVRWTFVFLHHPIWVQKDLTNTGWIEVENMLAGRKYTAYCGHLHTYRMYPRNGTNYYQLATTGGGSAVRGPEYGEFDQCAWITMKADGPVMANIVLNGVMPHDLAPIESTEKGNLGPLPGSLAEVFGKVTLDGKPMPKGMQVIFTEIVAKPVPDPNEPGEFKPGTTGNSRITDGSYTVFASRGAMGIKPGRYAVTFAPAQSLVIDPKAKPIENPIPEKYRTVSKTPFRVEIKKGEKNQLDFNLESQ